jgi:hypothetical protein
VRRSRPLRLLGVGAVAALLWSAGCTSSPSPTTAEPSVSSSSTTSASPTSAAVDTLIIGITVKGDQVTPNGEKLDVTKGQTVVLQVNSDTDDEIHAHTGGDGFELAVKAGKRTDGQFVAAQTGSFEIESHRLDKIIAILVVR